METAEKRLRVVLFQEEGAWVSQCIDFDLNGQGSSVQEALSSMVRVLITRATLDQKDHVTEFSSCRPAPDRYVEMFEKSLALRDTLPVRSQNFDRQADLRIHA